MKRKPNLRMRPQQGVALLEVLVSILLFSIGLLGLLGLQARAITFSVDAEDRNRAALLANDIAATMWITRSTVVDASAGSPLQLRVADATKDGLPSGEVEITAVNPTTADILITWKPPSRGTSAADSVLRTRVVLPQ